MTEVSYYFNSYDVGEVWANNPEYMVDNDTDTYTTSAINSDTQLLDGNTCDGTNLGTITKVELRLFGKISGGANTSHLVPVFSGTDDGDNHNMGSPSFSGEWSDYADITSDTNAPGTWSWSDVQNLDCDVILDEAGGTSSVSKVEIRVTYTATPAGPANDGTKNTNNYYYGV